MNVLQKKIYEIFLVIQEICERYELRYWAIGGTCIGAVRHNGFIPWDIDMDIGMPDVDYQRFLKIASKELQGSKYEVHSKLKGHMITRVCDATTTDVARDEIKHPERYKGIYVDIMPLCGIPSGKIKSVLYSYKMGVFFRLYRQKTLYFSDVSSLRGKINWILFRPILTLLPEDYFFNIWTKNASKYKFDQSEYTGYLWARVAHKIILKTKWFDSYIEFPFETTTIRCPKGYDNYLKIQFGDYMTLPPEEERERPDLGVILDLYHSYRYYQNKIFFSKKQDIKNGKKIKET